MPMTRSMWRGPRPLPTDAPPATGFDDVTNGYVPWSTSRKVAWAPSSRILRPDSRASCSRLTVSATYGTSRAPSSSNLFTTSSRSNPSPPMSASSRCAASPRSRTFAANDAAFSTSPTRMPVRRTLSAIAGPMPFRVVPMRESPRADSCAASIAWCHGKIRCARLETRNDDVDTPRDSRDSTSRKSVGRSTTTPLPITGVTDPYSTPLGTSCSAYFWSPTTTGWPALWPPW